MPNNSEAWLLRIISSNTLGALALIIWDTLITLDSEIFYIWRKPSTHPTKWLFIFLRYWGVLTTMTTFAVNSQFPFDHHKCQRWYGVQAVFSQSMLSAFEIVLMVRVYAMYNRSRRILVLLTFFFTAEIVVVVLNARHNIPHLTFTPTCFTVLDPGSVVYYATAILATQLVIGVLTLYKKCFGGRAAWGRTPLSQLIMRDGTTSFAVIFGLIVLDVVYVAMQNDVAFALIYWFFPLLSVIGCRLILNLQKLNRPKEETELCEYTTFRSF